ncbi:lysophospholipid acyltransferase family protein [Mucilaginibacter ximonensis]|uniref:Lysophospholipid acyltransferase family protein n=1 Tax=Mucilaginibacter ximonensis TaxID=538021 RepID=A0ABW5Y796_9SPHI
MLKNLSQRIGIFLLYLFSLLPFWVMYAVADLLYPLLYYVFHYRRRVVYQNLKNSFPEKSDREIHEIQRKFYRHLCDLIVETIKSVSISEKQIRRRVILTNPEVITNYHAQGRSLVAIGGHYCNWEWAGQNFPFYTENKFLIVYKPLTSAIFDRFFQQVRARFGTVPVAMNKAMRELVKLRNEQPAIALLGDQTPSREELDYFTDFLNQKTPVFLGVEKIARATNSVVLYYDMKKVKRGYYTYTLYTLFEDPKQTKEYEITKAHVKFLENIINREPQYWLWSHRRWKFKPEHVKYKR